MIFFLDDLEEFCLQGGLKISYLIEKHCASCRFFYLSGPPRKYPGIDILIPAEQLCLYELLWHSSAIDRNKQPVLFPEIIDRPCYKFFAGTGFPINNDITVRVFYCFNDIRYFAHLNRVAYYTIAYVFIRQIFFQIFKLIL